MDIERIISPLISAALGGVSVALLNKKEKKRSTTLQIQALLKLVYQHLSVARYRKECLEFSTDPILDKFIQRVFDEDTPQAFKNIQIELLFEAAYSISSLKDTKDETSKTKLVYAWIASAAALWALGQESFLKKVTLPELQEDLDNLSNYTHEFKQERITAPMQ